MQIKKSKKTTLRPTAETRRTVESHLAWAVGTDRLDRHDPLCHVTESFQLSFDRIGREHARAAAGGLQPEREEDVPGQAERKRAEQKKPAREPPAKDRREERARKPRSGNDADALIRFSEIAFQRGALSGAVLNGTGKLMLVSCLSRTADGSGPKHLQQQSVSGIGSQKSAVPGRAQDKLVFNRGFANSALGIVTDTLRDARGLAESMAEIARGAEGAERQDRAAMFKLYPFLDDSRDAALEAEYRDALARCTDEREKPVLQNALVQVLALRAKKAQMKTEFINKLRFLSDRAEEMLTELEEPGILDELAAAAFGPEPELPENPEDGEPGKPGKGIWGELAAAALGAAAARLIENAADKQEATEKEAGGDAPDGPEAGDGAAERGAPETAQAEAKP